ncbi:MULTISPECIES: sulfur carrier protein ThiS [Pseudoalteromonas]|uniref:Thiamine biosynthesis protein ThiS n=1 Tax=Pseudoalteromonas amylolytica TaxID=1859457 RepID=A0A1S1MSB8_9GAMM|nr:MULTISPECIES: sulfur carrier protein ThiS [Pseudoalteromonas]MCF6436509.1 sulfur carrier protein ThiS [Pseudoalteromonas sp. MMG022]OHU86144.1 thiamine biosynthesis protein ThiS [Pseudoalteromonas sp. JW3]OHU89749.1 thiamine biosynthesis protein ThiS [Pseudoalteromonas amylolytica]
MKITFNGQLTETSSQDLQALVTEMGAKEPFAVALNGTFVPRTQCSSTHLTDGDSIELLSPIQGG